MGLILTIETATEICSVALALNGNIISIRENEKGNSHSANVAVFIDEVLKESGKLPSDIEAVAISKGPGSYTGLRIGVSSAKGLCYALNIPLIAIDTLKSMSVGFLQMSKIEKNSLLCPMIDARRMEVYSAFYYSDLNVFRDVKAEIVDEATYADYLNEYKIYFFGNGAVKCREVIGNYENAIIVEDILLSAKNMVKLAEEKFINNEFENTAYFEPFYLKDFIAAKPVVKGLY
jgi:tRNA threonylcarbamoyladenosine biosynthesis protein TsaB